MRRKKSDAHPDDAATALAEPTNGHVAVLYTPAPEVSTEPSTGGPAAPKNRPAASFAANTDRTTRLEVAVWARVVTVSEQEEYTQYSLTITRSYRDKDGKWNVNGFYRIHDIPVLQFLLNQAYAWCVSRRMDVRVEGDESVPF